MNAQDSRGGMAEANGANRKEGHRLRSMPFLTPALGLAACAVHWVPGADAALQYSRAALAQGEIWRTVTGHWTHWSFELLFWDVAAFIGLGIVCERRGRQRCDSGYQ